MNLRAKPTPSQRKAQIDRLAQAVVDAAAAPTTSKKSKRGARPRASQKTRRPPAVPLNSSSPPAHLGGKGRGSKVSQKDARSSGNSSTQPSPSPPPSNIPPSSI